MCKKHDKPSMFISTGPRGHYIRLSRIMRFISVLHDLNLQVAHMCHFTIKTLVGADVPLFKLIQRLLVDLKNGSRRKQKPVRKQSYWTGQSQSLQARVTSCVVTFVARCLSGTEYSLRRFQCPRNNLLVTAEILTKLHCMFNELNTK